MILANEQTKHITICTDKCIFCSRMNSYIMLDFPTYSPANLKIINVLSSFFIEIINGYKVWDLHLEHVVFNYILGGAL